MKLIDPVHIYGIGCLQDLPLTQIVQESVSYLTGKYVNTGIGTVEQEPSLMFTVINETDKVHHFQSTVTVTGLFVHLLMTNYTETEIIQDLSTP